MFYVVCIKGSNQAAVVMNDAWMLSDGIFGFSHFWIRIAILSRLKWKRQRKFVSRIWWVESSYISTYAKCVRKVNMKMTFRISSCFLSFISLLPSSLTSTINNQRPWLWLTASKAMIVTVVKGTFQLWWHFEGG